MTAALIRDLPVDLQDTIAQSHRALIELAAGHVDPSRTVYARVDHTTLFGAYGGYDVGWQTLARRLDAIAPLVADSADGGHVTMRTLAAGASGDLGYTVALELYHAPAPHGGSAPDAPVARTLRVTQVFQRIEGTWRLVHRHADPQSGVGESLAATGWDPARPTAPPS